MFVSLPSLSIISGNNMARRSRGQFLIPLSINDNSFRYYDIK